MVLNYIWINFFFIAFLIGLYKSIFLGDALVFSGIINATFEQAKTAFELALFLTGTLSLWMGLMKIGEKAGLVHILSKVIGPFFRRIFPEIPPKHPVMTPMLMNFAANMLGLDNAATPLGLKAMEGMQELNPKKDTASDAQIMFLVLNTSGLTIIPISVMVYRAELGASNPAEVFLPILLATLVASLAGLVVVSIYQRINLLDPVILIYLAVILAFLTGTIYFFTQMESKRLNEVSALLSNMTLTSLIILLIILGAYKKLNVYEVFIAGAKEGFGVAIKIIPYLIAILVAIGVFRASGALNMLVDSIGWLMSFVGLGGDYVQALPTALMKPLSGSGARGMMVDAIQTYGVDSFVGKLAATMQGTTDTTFYILALYFGSVSIRKTRYAITCGLLADLAGIISAIFIAYVFFK